jgi:hypothetical protein
VWTDGTVPCGRATGDDGVDVPIVPSFVMCSSGAQATFMSEDSAKGVARATVWGLWHFPPPQETEEYGNAAAAQLSFCSLNFLWSLLPRLRVPELVSLGG